MTRALEQDLDELVGADNPAAVRPVLRVVTKETTQWDRCKGWIEAGLEGGPLTLVDLKQAVDEQRAILWPGKACALVTEFIDYPSGQRVAHVMSAGGELDEIKAMIPGLEAFGRLNGASKVFVEGRRGWERALKDLGYGFQAITLAKEL